MDPNKDSNSFCIYVHFDSRNSIHRYVREQLATLSARGYRIIFVSHAVGSPPLETLSPFCTIQFHRQNIGHDFGAYHFGLRYLQSRGAHPAEVILTNDSCYGYFGDLTNIIEASRSSDALIWWLTDSYEIAYHVQSYFLRLSGELLSSLQFWRFWEHLPNTTDRSRIIRKGEVGFTQHMIKRGITVDCFAPYEQLALGWLKLHAGRVNARPGEKAFLDYVESQLVTNAPVNPSHCFVEALLERGVPLVKRDLLRHNPLKVPNLLNIAQIITAKGSDFSATSEHLKIAV
ncbi:rhamnan synthesis F family protein [Aestuariivirga litoralis]|nr:rhamnan synthesis F family protein [Aestuariivirga litoralis]